MNPMTNVKNVQKLNERELERGVTGNSSWHRQYKDSAWVFIGGLPYELSEGDVISVFSQYGEIVNMNLVRDKATGKSKGFCFLCYEDQRSTILAVDNFNSTKLLGRTIRVDHCENYKQPKDTGEEDDMTKTLRSEGCAPGAGVDVTPEEPQEAPSSKRKKEKKSKKHKRKRGEVGEERVKVKKEKIDPGYDNHEKRVDDRGTEETGHGATRTRNSHQGDSRDYGSKAGCRTKVDKHRRDEDKDRSTESKRRSREEENDSRHRSKHDRVRSQGKGGRSRDKRSKDRSDGSTSSDSE